MDIEVSSASGNILSSGSIFGGTVATYADLPNPAAYNNKVFYVLTTTGFWPLTIKYSGYYKSNGSAWLKWEADSEAIEALSQHISDTSTHGVAGDIVGTTDSQALTNKTIDYNQNTLLNFPTTSTWYANQTPVESPDDSRTTFTIPNSHVVRTGRDVEVKLNGSTYQAAHITLNPARTQFTIINDIIPKTTDSLSVSYDKE